MTATKVASCIRDFGGRGVIKSQVLAAGPGRGNSGNGFEGGVFVVSVLANLPCALCLHGFGANALKQTALKKAEIYRQRCLTSVELPFKPRPKVCPSARYTMWSSWL